MPRRYVLTGAPGSGKTVLLRALAQRGQAVVEEAATDVITRWQSDGVNEPWTRSDFCDRIAAVQRQRQTAPIPPGVQVQFFDRSPLCTLALARYLGHPVTPALAQEIDRVVAERVYRTTVFLVRPIGMIETTAVRRIGYADALIFQTVHETVYRQHGYSLVDVPLGPIPHRAAFVQSVVSDEIAISTDAPRIQSSHTDQQ